ncbi:hypothetical protein KEM48_011665 [Puccinia striiformis f. sp. tritici PST-130]|nr:hypothetical protein KEM48_011665 [Puccinia striiformis f. sp. tritici PST-130]
MSAKPIYIESFVGTNRHTCESSAAKSSGGFIWDAQGASSGLDDPSSSADASLSEEPDSEADVSSGSDSDDDESPSAFRARCIINTDSQISKRLTCHTTSDINRISDENLISDLEQPSTVPSDQQPERNIDNQLLSQQNNLSFQPDKNNSSSLIKRISLSLPNTNSVE